MSQAAEHPDELDAALARVEDLGDAPLHEHAEAFEHDHEILQTRLRDAER